MLLEVRLFENHALLITLTALTKNGATLLAAPPKLDLSKYKTDKKIVDEELLKILERPVARNTGAKSKNKKKKKKPAKQAAQGEEEEEEDSDDDE